MLVFKPKASAFIDMTNDGGADRHGEQKTFDIFLFFLFQ
jgi:hypothetical protein